MTQVSVVRLLACTIDLDTNIVISHEGRPTATLNDREASLLSYLLGRENQIVPREELLREVWGVRSRTTRALDMCVRRLRLQIERDPTAPDHLHTVKGMGYRLEIDASEGPHGASSLLPARLAPMFGREEVIRLLTAHIEGGARLVTITGPPGIGKTSIAYELARTQLHRSQGLWFCELADAQTEAQIRETLGSEIGVVGEIGTSLRLLGRPLLVLDNVEQVLGPMTALLGQWLARSEAVFLVTSREALGIGGEIEVQLEPLSVEASVDVLRDRSGKPWATAEAGELATLAELLDGVPLALEIAASRSRAFQPHQIATALEGGLGVLHHAGQVLPRHRSYEAALEWSWQLLDDQERATLQQLSVFSGATLEAALAVIVVPGESGSDILEALVRKSILRRSNDPDGCSRFRVPTAIAQFIAMRTPPAPAEALARHRAWSSALALRWYTAQPGTSRAMMLAESSNLRRALASCDAAQADDAAQILMGLLPWVHATGQMRWLVEEIERYTASPALSARWICRLNSSRAEANILLHSGDPRVELERVLSQARVHDARLVPRILRDLAHLDLNSDDLDAAEARLVEALSLNEAVNHERCAILKHLASLRRRQGRLDEARRLAGEILRAARQIDSPIAEALALSDLLAGAQSGREKIRTLDRALTLLDGYPALIEELHVLNNLVEALCDEGEIARGLPLAQRGLREASRAGLSMHAAMFATNLGLMLLALERPAEGKQRLLWALQTGSTHPAIQFGLRFGLATAHLAESRLDEAAALLDDASEPAARIGQGCPETIATAHEILAALAAGAVPARPVISSTASLTERALDGALAVFRGSSQPRSLPAAPA